MRGSGSITDCTDPTGPVISDPGDAGWPAPPKVSAAEVALFAEHAEVVRLLGQASVAASDAYSLACKVLQDNPGFVAHSDDEACLREVVQVAWQLCENARATYREVAEVSIARTRRIGGEMFGGGQASS